MKANTMKMELPKQLNVAGLQKQMSADWASARTASHKTLLAAVGAWALMVDGAAGVYKSGVQLFNDAEARGEQMERDFAKRFQYIEERATKELHKAQRQVGENVEQMKSTVVDTRSEVEEELEKRVELVLANLGIPSRERLERLSQEIEYLNQKLDLELQKADAGERRELVLA